MLSSSVDDNAYRGFNGLHQGNKENYVDYHITMEEKFRQISEELRKDRGFVLKAVRQYGLALAHAPQVLKDDREVVLAAVRENGKALKYASEELRNDREFVSKAVSLNKDCQKFHSYISLPHLVRKLPKEKSRAKLLVPCFCKHNEA